MASRRSSKYILILHWTLGFNILDKDSYKPTWEMFWDLAHLILETFWYYNMIWIVIKPISPANFAVTSQQLRNTIWWNRSVSAPGQVMACWLTPPRHYLNQYWLMTSKDQCHSPESNFTNFTQASITKMNLKIIYLSFKSSRTQCPGRFKWKINNFQVHLFS